MKKVCTLNILTIIVLLGLPGFSQAQQAPTDPKKSLECLITTDFYIVHLTSYLEPNKDSKKRNRFKPFCQELPEHGSGFLAIDFLDRDLRKMPVGLRVISEVEDPETGELVEETTIANTDAKTYKNGVAQIQANFPKPGHYALIATVGDDMFADKIRIPLRVGIGSAFHWSSLLPYLLAILAAGIAYVLYRFFISRHNKKENDTDINI